MASDPSAHAPIFGDLLRRHRRARELTQEELAERAGVSARAVSDLERGARAHPYRETANRLADALNLTGSERAAFLDGSTCSAAPGPIMPAPYGTRFPRRH